MEDSHTWGSTNAGVLGAKPVAYFSAEFGIHESVPIYSGGLGVLAGDHIKSASGLGVPLVAIGLFYSQGYFTPVSRRDRDAGRRLHGHQGREPADASRPSVPMGSRSWSTSIPAPAASKRRSG